MRLLHNFDSSAFFANFTNVAGATFINNGKVKLTKTFTNQSGARVDINGGTLSVEKFYNSGVISFSALNSTMGQLQVTSFINENGEIKVNVSGLTADKYQIINGVITGLNNNQVSFLNTDTSKTYTYNEGWIYVADNTSGGDAGGSTGGNTDGTGGGTDSGSGSGGSGSDGSTDSGSSGGDSGGSGGDSGGSSGGDSGGSSGGETPTPTPEPTPTPTPEPVPQPSPSIAQKTNQQSLQNAIESKFAEFYAGQGTKDSINQIAADTEQTIQKSVIAQPKNMLKAFKADTLTTPLNSAYASRLTASSDLIMSDAGNFANPLEKTSQTQFFAMPFGGVLSSDDLNGHLLGLTLGLTHISENYIAQGHFSYGRGQSKQDLATQSADTTGDLFQLGGFTRLFASKAEFDINANFVLGKFSIDNAWLASEMSSSSNFNNYQANLGLVVGWRFGEKLSFKPFVGTQGYYEKQDEFKQDGGLGLASDAYNATTIDALAGVEARYIFENGGFGFVKFGYESKIHNSHKEVFMRVDNEQLVYENESYNSVMSGNLGFRVLSLDGLKLDIEGIYKRYDNGLNYFGGNVGVKFVF